MIFAVLAVSLARVHLGFADVCHQDDESCVFAVVSDDKNSAVVLLQKGIATRSVVPDHQIHDHLVMAGRELQDDGVLEWEFRCNCPGTASQLRDMHSDVGSALKAGSGEKRNIYGKMQAMMSRIQEVKERYPSGFDAFWDTIPKLEDGFSVSVEDFQKAWTELGMKRHNLIGQLSTISQEQEESMAKTADMNGDGAVSRDEGVNYLHTCIEVTSNMVTTMVPSEFCQGDSALCMQLGHWLGLF